MYHEYRSAGQFDCVWNMCVMFVLQLLCYYTRLLLVYTLLRDQAYNAWPWVALARHSSQSVSRATSIARGARAPIVGLVAQSVGRGGQGPYFSSPHP